MTDPDRVPAALAARIQSEPWAQHLGLEYLALERGYCRVALTLKPEMLNYQGYAHGGVVFSLADVAFGAACNSHGEVAVALTMSISFLAAVRPGARLVAEARVRKQGRRAGFYDVTVTGEDSTVVAVLHCVAHRVSPVPSRRVE